MVRVLKPDELSDFWLGAKRIGLSSRGADRAIAFAGHQTQETEDAICIGPELVPGHGWNVHEIECRNCFDGIAHHHAPAPAQYDYGVYVLMPLKARMSAGCDLEVAQFVRQAAFSIEKQLPADSTKMGVMLFVGAHIYTFPAEAVRSAARSADGRRRFIHCVPGAIVVHAREI